MVLSRTQSDGRHAAYRHEGEVFGNLKLAQRKDGDRIVTLIETRGEGGLFLCAPTDGYELIQGNLCDLPVLTEAERELLLQAAWALNEYTPPAVGGPGAATLARVRNTNGQASTGNLKMFAEMGCFMAWSTDPPLSTASKIRPNLAQNRYAVRPAVVAPFHTSRG